MICRTCGNDSHRVSTTFFKESVEENGVVVIRNTIKDTCTHCGLLANHGALFPDVAYPYGSGEHSEENISYPKGHEKEGQPIPFSSRRGKAEAMKIAGVREAGDRHHGSLSRFH